MPNDTSKRLGLTHIKERNLPSETVLWNLLPDEVLDGNIISRLKKELDKLMGNRSISGYFKGQGKVVPSNIPNVTLLCGLGLRKVIGSGALPN